MSRDGVSFLEWGALEGRAWAGPDLSDHELSSLPFPPFSFWDGQRPGRELECRAAAAM